MEINRDVSAVNSPSRRRADNVSYNKTPGIKGMRDDDTFVQNMNQKGINNK